MEETAAITQVMEKVCKLSLQLQAHPMNQYEGCWEYRIDDEWWIALNGHGEDRRCSFGTDVPPYSVFVKFGDLPAGVFNSFGGSFVQHPNCNEDKFLAAIRRAIDEVAA